MTPFKKRTCPITQRLAEDMLIRNLAEATIDAYTYHVRSFADFIEKPLAQTTVEDVRIFQLHLIRERKLAYSSFNQAVCVAAAAAIYREAGTRWMLFAMGWSTTLAYFAATVFYQLSRYGQHQCNY